MEERVKVGRIMMLKVTYEAGKASGLSPIEWLDALKAIVDSTELFFQGKAQNIPMEAMADAAQKIILGKEGEEV